MIKDVNLSQFESLARVLKDEITSGKFQPGEKIPTFQEMESRFNASRGVLQLTINVLKQDGFITSKKRQGLFVNAQPPHLCRYALVFSSRQSSESWSRVCQAIVNEGPKLFQKDGRSECVVFDGVADPVYGPAMLENLEDAIKKQLLAGVILFPGTFHLMQRSGWKESGIPKVFVYSDPSDKRYPLITNSNSIQERALGFLKSKNRKRNAVIYMADTRSYSSDAHFKKLNLEYNSKWIQPIGRSHPETIQNLIPLLFDYPENERPDGLYLADDNFVELALAEIISLGLQIGKDIDIVAHCNWPWPIPTIAPIKRIGFHAGELLERCIATIDDQRQGLKCPDEQYLMPLFEDELTK